MSNSQNVPASLIEQDGTGEDKHGLVGKRIRITQGPPQGHPLCFILGVLYEGAEGTIIHVGGEGELWADFGDDEDVVECGPEQVRVHGIGNQDEEEEAKSYELLA